MMIVSHEKNRRKNRIIIRDYKRGKSKRMMERMLDVFVWHYWLIFFDANFTHRQNYYCNGAYTWMTHMVFLYNSWWANHFPFVLLNIYGYF